MADSSTEAGERQDALGESCCVRNLRNVQNERGKLMARSTKVNPEEFPVAKCEQYTE